MKSQITYDFRACFMRLPPRIQERARKSYRLWKQDHAHPSLQFKAIHAHHGIYSVRISRNYRALGLVQKDIITWFWIGTHAEYDRLIK